MMKLLAFLTIVLVFVSGAYATTASLTLNQPQPIFGQTVTFTAVYPGAARQKIGQRVPFQPQIDVFCAQNGAPVYGNSGESATEKNLGGGWWQGITGPFTLGGFSSYGGTNYQWDSGGADCTAVLGYFTTNPDKSLQWHDVADLSFRVTGS